MVGARISAWWLRGVALSLLVLLALLAGCAPSGAASTPGGVSNGPSATATASAAPVCASASCGATGVQVFVEPDAGEAPVLHAIEGANVSLDVEIYLLTDRTVTNALEDAAARGVDVQVLLETAPYGESGVSPQETLQKLNAAGVHAQGADPEYTLTHAKMMLVDGATAYIMTCNLTRSGLGGSSYTTNREYGVIDTDAADVAEVAAIFAADWARTAPFLNDPNLVVSPVDARPKLLDLIASARTSLDLEDEEMLDIQSEDALVAAAHRGVAVELILPLPGAGTPPDSNLARLIAGGIHVRYSATLYMHAKLILQDSQRAFVGSENFSANSLDHNREVGVLISAPEALQTLATTFGGDWSAGITYSA